MTNEEKLKSKCVWDFADFIFKVSNGAIKITKCNQACRFCKNSENYCISKIAEWLMTEETKI